MRTAIITVAGISSRFNQGIPESQKKLKAIYYEKNREDTLLYHMLSKCSSVDRIFVVGGYKFEELRDYCNSLEKKMENKTQLVFNEYYDTLASGYSFYLGLEAAFREKPDEILFIEGDLDVDQASFDRVLAAESSILTYTYEPIYASKAVALYQDEQQHFHYAFNSDHGLLSITSPFSCILNSGQMWKFTDIEKLRTANSSFFAEDKNGTNLRIIQNYLDQGVRVELVDLKRWTNCNTRIDYNKILHYWEEEQ